MSTHPDDLQKQERRDLFEALRGLMAALETYAERGEGMPAGSVELFAESARAAVEKARGVDVPGEALGTNGWNSFSVRRPLLAGFQVGEAVRLRGAFAEGVYLIAAQGAEWTMVVRPMEWWK